MGGPGQHRDFENARGPQHRGTVKNAMGRFEGEK